MGMIIAILAFITIILPWYSATPTLFGETRAAAHASLLDLVNPARAFSGLLGGQAFAQVILPWPIWVALTLIIIGGLLGLIASFIIGGKGKRLLVVAGILVLLSPIIFAIGFASQGIPLFGSVEVLVFVPPITLHGTVALYLSFGFFFVVIVAVLMFISTKKHPMEAEADSPLSPQ